jgi:lipoprotein-releasing system permease protein
VNINAQIAKTYIVTNKKLTGVAVAGVVLGMSIYIFMNSMLLGFDKSSSNPLIQLNF